MKITTYRLGDRAKGEQTIVPDHEEDGVWYARVEVDGGWWVEITQVERPNTIGLRTPGSLTVVPCSSNAIDIEKG